MSLSGFVRQNADQLADAYSEAENLEIKLAQKPKQLSAEEAKSVIESKMFFAIEQAANIVANSETFRHYELLVNQKPDWFAKTLAAAQSEKSTATILRFFEEDTEYKNYMKSHKFFKELVPNKAEKVVSQMTRISEFLTLWDVHNGREKKKTLQKPMKLVTTD
jgi:uncharacterized protein YktA (UPF0223 family)